MNASKKRIVYTALVTLIIVFSSTFAILMTLERTDYRNYLQGEYSKNMYELIDSVQNIRVDLSKAGIVGSREQSIIVFSDIFRYSSSANDKLNSLPIGQDITADTNKFLSQVGDFCYTLSKAASEGKELTEKDYSKIEDLKNRSFSLEQNLKQISNDINQGKVKWGEIRKKASGVFAKNDKELVSEKFENIQKQIAQYPALIYDGPFSDNVLEITPKINSEKLIDEKSAEKVVRKIIGENKIEKITLDKNQGKTKIETYRFNITNKNSKEIAVCEISKRGGKVTYLLDDRGIGKPSINPDKAVEIGEKYLKNIGYENMKSMYSLKYDNSVVVSYVYSQNNIIMYPDQIKLKIALDNGGIIGIESEKYLIAHTNNRNIPKPKVGMETAKSRVGKNLKLKSQRLAVVPTETDTEVLCYEFGGSYKGEDFVVFINAQTGFEQKIIQVINTPNGKLTM